MLNPPVLEIYVVWHPEDSSGSQVFEWVFSHFHGAAYSGLVGGAVEIYARSEGWNGPGRPPRPLPFMDPLPAGLPAAAVTAIVPVLGTRLARAVESDPEWLGYMEQMLAADSIDPTVGIFSLIADDAATAEGSALASLFGAAQSLDRASIDRSSILCRDLAHSIGRLIGDPLGDRLQVFISHTKRFSPDEAPDSVLSLVQLVRDVIANTHLAPFYDQADLQPGSEWRRTLRENASKSGLLAVRTDLYASREWCQEEILTAKWADMPIVVIQALHSGEERGSFLMDHVPTLPICANEVDDIRASIERALDLLVDEALKRALWRYQRSLLERHGFDWLPSNAPEPTTLIGALMVNADLASCDPLMVMHPDPPLGGAEQEVIVELAKLAGLRGIEILTPRTFASRGGRLGE